MPQGRPRKYDDDYHNRLRAKVRKHRAKHKARLALQAQQRALERGREPQASKAKWRLFERTEPRDEPTDVVLVRYDQDAPED